MASIEVALDFPSYLQTLMIRAGFDAEQSAVYNPAFLQFLHLSLLSSAEKLHQLKKNTFQDISREEQELLQFLSNQKINSSNSSSEIKQKSISALELFKEGQKRYLSNIMINSGFQVSETEESHNSYTIFLSSFLTSETTKITNYKPTKKAPPQKLKSDGTNISDVVEFEDLEICDSSFKIIATTKKHCLYHVSTPHGYRVLKVLKSRSPRSKDIENLINELTIVDKVEHHAFRQSFARTTYRNRHAIMLEWIEGHPVSDITESTAFNVLIFLTIAKDLVSALMAMHAKQNSHMNLNCEHILVINRETAYPTIKIIACGSSSSYNKDKLYISNRELLSANLCHVSPEQTGRTNRRIDFRSDFYSLGIVFYKLISGRYPFEEKNISKLMTLHLLQDSPPIPNIPTPISDMITKLLRKDPDERYQSAKGILHDLYLMTSEYASDNSLKSVVLSQHDILETFIIKQKLYGRTTEYNTLLSVFDKLTPTTLQTVFVSGKSGSGKSSLVLELYKSITIKNGIILSGNCSKSKPYSVWIEAVGRFCSNLSLEDDTTIANHRSILQDSVGEEGKILTDIIPSLHSIIGAQPAITDAFGNQAKQRFDYVFIKLIKAICSFGRPVILVLEDSQNVDLTSIDLLSSMINSSITNLMLIGVYRDEEVTDTHPIKNLLQDITKLNVNMTEIILKNMDHESVNELISDTLFASPLETYTLTAIVHEKTKGSPFFVHQMLTSLSEQRLISFCDEKRKWLWDVSALVENQDVAGNVNELLKQKILSLDKRTQQALKIASCLGGSFSCATLKHILDCGKGIHDALEKGMICKGSDHRYRFVHAQMKEVVTSLLPKDNRNKLYLYIGKKLWNLITNKGLNEDLSTVVELLRHTIDIVTDSKERLKMAELFMQVGEEAMGSTAFRQALKHFQIGIKLLSSNCWKKNYEFSLQMHNYAATAAFSVANYSKMSTFLDEISTHATSALHLVQSYVIQIRCYNDRRMYKEALEKGLCILEKIGESRLCANTRSISEDKSIITSEVYATKNFFNGISKETLSSMREIEDENLIAVVLVLSSIITSVHMNAPQLVPLISSRMIQITFSHGISKYSSVGFVLFGAFLSSRGDKLGYEVGNYALFLLHKMRVKEVFPLVYTAYYHLVHPHNASVHLSHAPLLKSYRVALETGMLDISTLSANGYCICAFNSGKNLESFEDDIEKLNDRLPIKSMAFSSVRQAVLKLRSDVSDPEINPAVLTGEAFDCYTCFDENKAPGDVSRSSTQCFFMAYLFYDYPLALRFVERAKPFASHIASSYQYPIFLFYNALTSLAVARNVSLQTDKDNLIFEAKECMSKLNDMSQVLPDNCLNKVHLIEAEIQVVLSNNTKALEHYSDAISLSKKYGFIHEEALACERAGLFLLQQNVVDSAYKFLLQSYFSYEAWGANAKTKHLVTCYPLLLDEVEQSKSKKKHSIIAEDQLELDEHSLASVSLLTNGSYCTFSSHFTQRKRVRFS